MSTSDTRRSAPTRLDERSEFCKLIDSTGAVLTGRWHLVRGVGELGYAGVVFAQDENTGMVVPLAAVRQLVP